LHTKQTNKQTNKKPNIQLYYKHPVGVADYVKHSAQPPVMLKTFITTLYMLAVFKTNRPCYNFAIDDPQEKNYATNEMALKTLQT
jgi:hypothetical protein